MHPVHVTVLPKELPGSARSGMAWQVRVESAKPMDLLVMENVFYERSLAPVYDLKGSERARLVQGQSRRPHHRAPRREPQARHSVSAPPGALPCCV